MYSKAHKANYLLRLAQLVAPRKSKQPSGFPAERMHRRRLCFIAQPLNQMLHADLGIPALLGNHNVDSVAFVWRCDGDRVVRRAEGRGVSIYSYRRGPVG
jgi:hypothetical protein